MKQPFISVGIPIYNAGKYLALAIQSVINQSYQNWELILIDDGSTDNSLQIAKRFEAEDERIRVISDGQNKKLPYRLNQIIDEAKYDYIMRMDADDMIHPKKIEIQIEFLIKNPQYDLVSTGLVSVDKDHKAYGYRNISQIHTEFRELKRSYPIVHASIMAKTSWYKRNKYRLDYPRCEDYELWCRTSLKNDLNIAILPNLLYYYREEGLLELDKLIRSHNDNYKVYREYMNKFSLRHYIVNTVKKKVIICLDSIGLLQHIARKRNKTSPSSEVLREHQKVINNLISLL